MSLIRIACLAVSLALVSGASLAAETAGKNPAAKPADAPANNSAIMAEKARADKKAMVAANLGLTEGESKAFWPVYEEYQKGLAALVDGEVNAMNAFAKSRQAGASVDEASKKLVTDLLAGEQAELDLRKAMAAKVQAALPPAKAARYLQIESRVRLAGRAQLVSRLPIVGGPIAGMPGASAPVAAPAKAPAAAPKKP
ncbi:MAG: hypothetical protein ACLGHJ_04865 [Gammaproteobacteria bacterium]